MEDDEDFGLGDMSNIGPLDLDDPLIGDFGGGGGGLNLMFPAGAVGTPDEADEILEEGSLLDQPPIVPMSDVDNPNPNPFGRYDTNQIADIAELNRLATQSLAFGYEGRPELLPPLPQSPLPLASLPPPPPSQRFDATQLVAPAFGAYEDISYGQQFDFPGSVLHVIRSHESISSFFL
jgi:hypothetical protein